VAVVSLGLSTRQQVNTMARRIVEFNFTDTRLMVGAWARVPVVIEPRSGLKFEDLDFTVPKGVCAGVVSTARETTFAPAAHSTIMLCAGYLPGKYELLAVDKAKKTKVGQAQFEVVPVSGDG
jgi:hypothetical protein